MNQDDTEDTVIISPSQPYDQDDPQDAASEGLIEMMRNEPGALFWIVAEWVGIVLLIACGLSIIFLLVLGAHSLVRIAP